MEEQPQQTSESEKTDNALLVRNITIAACLGLLGLFVTTVGILTILLAENINILDWME